MEVTVEGKFDLKPANWHGEPAKAPTKAQASLLDLGALVREWEAAAKPGTAEATFRSAVSHGVNVQYETLMVREDPANTKTHQLRADTEAARADACLNLLLP
jgi:hypothetical protein